MIKVFAFDFYAFLDQGASLSFVTSYVENKFNILLEKLREPFCVSTHVGVSILVEIVYNTMDYLVKLDMVNFDGILGMD